MRSAARTTTLICFATLMAASGPGLADPLVGPGNVPGAIAAWSTTKNITSLTVAEGFEAEAIAEAIIEALKGASAKAAGNQISVTGVSEKQLLSALQKIDVDSTEDDVDAMLSALQTPGGDEDDSGSSIRASRPTDMAAAGAAHNVVFGLVTAVQHARYPLVVVSVKLQSGDNPKGVSGGQVIRVLPYIRSVRGLVDVKDPQSQVNVGAWYARKGDRVKVTLKPEAHKTVWVAEAFERVR